MRLGAGGGVFRGVADTVTAVGRWAGWVDSSEAVFIFRGCQWATGPQRGDLERAGAVLGPLFVGLLQAAGSGGVVVHGAILILRRDKARHLIRLAGCIG